MMQKCPSPTCGRPFGVATLGGGVPGGKEREEIRCPHCDHLVHAEMTSACFHVTKPTPEQEAAWFAAQNSN